MEVLDQPNNSHRTLEEIEKNNYVFKFGDYIGQGIEIFKRSPWLFIAYGVVSLVISVVPFIYLNAVSGFYHAARKVDKGEELMFEDFFEGFKGVNFLPLFIAGIVMPIIVGIGLLLCILPGIYLAVGYTFIAPMILFYNKDFWQAMEASRRVITKQWFMMLLFLIVIGILAQLGILACFVGVFVTFPLYHLAQYAAYTDIMGMHDSPTK